jgi:hypothetical protein
MNHKTPLKDYYTKLDRMEEIVVMLCAAASTCVMLAAILLPLYLFAKH